ncbi:hypothetical protein OB236_10240 [Paenibacillus sp. WQ 127069]|uniref:Uncharacterized protein n=2 Tax=Paenibacillus baimaensis TaxID=2982185 RepID=A0ABT2UF46_9BACL|nr:hypothetical protein [Paenibacillus sp. WQ 127069]
MKKIKVMIKTVGFFSFSILVLFRKIARSDIRHLPDGLILVLQNKNPFQVHHLGGTALIHPNGIHSYMHHALHGGAKT